MNPGVDETPFAPPRWIAQGAWQRWKVVWRRPPGYFDRLRNAVRVAFGHFRPRQLKDRLLRLHSMGVIESVPDYWQILVAAQHNMLGAAAVETKKFYRAQGIGFTEHNWRRFFCDPATMMDATGLFQARDDIVRHILQTFHRHPVYDFELLRMFEQGPDELLRQTELVADGKHPMQHQFDNLIEEPGYHARVLRQVRDFVRSPNTVVPLPLTFPYDADPTLTLAMEQFTTLAGFLRYAARLDAGSLRFWKTLGQNVLAMLMRTAPPSIDPVACDPDLQHKYGLHAPSEASG